MYIPAKESEPGRSESKPVRREQEPHEIQSHKPKRFARMIIRLLHGLSHGIPYDNIRKIHSGNICPMNAGWNTGIYFDNLQFSRIFFLHNIKIGKTDPLQFIEHSCTNPHERIMPYGFAITTHPTFKREITHYFQYSLSCQMPPGGSKKHYIIIYTRMIDKMLQGTSTKLPIYHRKLSMDILNGIDLDNSSGSG